MYRYKVYKSGNKVVALSTFAGKAVRGIAKCDPRDEYSAEFGETLAVARCDAKISEKRVASATKKLAAASNALAEAQKQFENMTRYYTDSVKKSADANERVIQLLNTIAP